MFSTLEMLYHQEIHGFHAPAINVPCMPDGWRFGHDWLDRGMELKRTNTINAGSTSGGGAGPDARAADQATLDELLELRAALKNDIALLRGDMRELRTELTNSIALLRTEARELETHMTFKFIGMVLMAALIAVALKLF